MAQKKRHISKQGISPLIATVLIIGFTVALAVLIINWGNTFTRNIQDQTESSADVQITCAQDVVFSVKSAKCNAATHELEVTVANDGTEDIDSFIIRVTNQTGNVQQAEIDFNGQGLDSFNIKSDSSLIYRNGGATLDDIDVPSNVELIPRITVNGAPQTCSANKAEYGGDTAVALEDCTL